MVHLTQLSATEPDIADALEDAIRKRLGDLNSGKYRSNNGYVLRLFAAWLRADQGIQHVGDVDEQVMRSWSRALRDVLGDNQSDIGTASTVEQYYAYVSAFLGWAVREGLLDSNPADSNTAREPLPESDAKPDRQFWTKRDRVAICTTADRLVDESFDSDDRFAKFRAFRDRALVYTLAYTGCRGAELAAVPGDDKRNGLRWTSVDHGLGLLFVYGKTREREDAPILQPAEGPLQRWEQVLDPPDPTWPVFPTLHLPSLYAELPSDIDASPDTVWQDLREHDCTPPSIKVQGIRRILKRLCEDSEYEFDEPLKPHGARRGLGDQLYQERAELAQDVLRHQDLRTTNKSYRERKAEATKEQADRVVGGETGE